MRWPSQKTIAWTIYYIFLACLLTANSFGYLDPDYGWHLKFGEIIAKTKAVPNEQIFMWPIEGKTWVDHEWLANLTSYLINSVFGYLGLSLFFILLPILTLGLINYYAFKNFLHSHKERVIFSVIEVAALISCLPHFGVRMQEFTFLFLAIELLIINYCRKNKNVTQALWLIPLLFLWACLHGGYLIGAAIIVGWLTYETILIIFSKIKSLLKEDSLLKKDYYLLLLIIALSLAGTALTPYGFSLYDFLKDYGTNRYYLSHIEEWRSPYSSPFRYDQIIYSVFIFSLGLGLQLFGKNKLKLWQVVLSLALLAAASRSVRHFPLWALASLIFILPLATKEALGKIKVPYSKFINYLLIICLIITGSSLLVSAKINNQPFKKYCSEYPCAALDFIKKEAKYSKLRMLNDYGWGGFIIGTNPNLRPFIDGRLPQYPFNNKSILEEYSQFFNKLSVEQKLKEHSIELIIFKSKEKPYTPDWFEKYVLLKKYRERKNPLLEFLQGSSWWEKVYSDDLSVVYVKKDKK